MRLGQLNGRRPRSDPAARRVRRPDVAARKFEEVRPVRARRVAALMHPEGDLAIEEAGLIPLHPPTAQSLLAEQLINRARSEEHTSELQSRENLVCRLLLE